MNRWRKSQGKWRGINVANRNFACGKLLCGMALLTNSGEVIYELLPVPRVIDLADAPKLIVPLRLVERRAIESAMILCLGNRRIAAAHLGISYANLRNKLRGYLAEDEQDEQDGRKAKSAVVGK